MPVDTHVLQIAQRDYRFRSKDKSMTKAVYLQIRAFFTDLWGDYAGWAHSVLFTADLRAFKTMTVQTSQVVAIKTEVNKEQSTKDEYEQSISVSTIENIKNKRIDLDLKQEENETISPRAQRRAKRDLYIRKDVAIKRLKVKAEPTE